MTADAERPPTAPHPLLRAAWWTTGLLLTAAALFDIHPGTTLRAVLPAPQCPEVGSWSFPGNHATIAFSLATLVVLLSVSAWAWSAHLAVSSSRGLGLGALEATLRAPAAVSSSAAAVTVPATPSPRSSSPA